MDRLDELDAAINSLMNRMEIVERFLSKQAQQTESTLVYPFSDPPNPSIKFISVHHSASRADVDRSDVIAWHQNNGWPAEHSGYHAFIKATGEIEWGDMDATLKYIVGHQNPHTLGVCLAGNFHPSEAGYTGHPTPAQLKSLREMLAIWQSRYPAAKVVPHKFFGGTVCPGDTLAAWLEENYAN